MFLSHHPYFLAAWVPPPLPRDGCAWNFHLCSVLLQIDLSIPAACPAPAFPVAFVDSQVFQPTSQATNTVCVSEKAIHENVSKDKSVGAYRGGRAIYTEEGAHSSRLRGGHLEGRRGTTSARAPAHAWVRSCSRARVKVRACVHACVRVCACACGGK